MPLRYFKSTAAALCLVLMVGCSTQDLPESEYPNQKEIEIAFQLKSLQPSKVGASLNLEKSAVKPLCFYVPIRRIETNEKDETPEFVFQSESMDSPVRDVKMLLFSGLGLLDSFEKNRFKAGNLSSIRMVKLNNKGAPYFYKLNSENYCVQAAKVRFAGITNIPGAKGRAVPMVPVVPLEKESLYPNLKAAYKIKVNLALTDQAPWIKGTESWIAGENVKWIWTEKAYSFNIAKYQGMWLPAEYVEELVKQENAANYGLDTYTKLLTSIKNLYLEAKFEENARGLSEAEIRSLLSEGSSFFKDKGAIVLPISYNYKHLEPDIGDPETNVIAVSNQDPFNKVTEAKSRPQSRTYSEDLLNAQAEVNWKLRNDETLDLLIKHRYAAKSISANANNTVYALTKDFSFQSSANPNSSVIYTKFNVYDYSFGKVVSAKEIDTGDSLITKVTVELTGAFKPQAKSLIEENPGLFNPYKRFTITKTKSKSDKVQPASANISKENTKTETVEGEFGY